jgi:hypothetical protein
LARVDVVAAIRAAPDVKQQTVALELILDDRVDIRETWFMVLAARGEINWRTSQQFVRDHQDELFKRLPSGSASNNQAVLAYVFTGECSAAHRDENADYVTRVFAGLPGGARTPRRARARRRARCRP